MWLCVIFLLFIEILSIGVDYLVGLASAEAVLWIYKFRQECYDPLKRLQRIRR